MDEQAQQKEPRHPRDNQQARWWFAALVGHAERVIRAEPSDDVWDDIERSARALVNCFDERARGAGEGPLRWGDLATTEEPDPESGAPS